MNSNLNLGLKGAYKVDLYNGKKLVETIDWFSNDITNWGLTYPLDYSFARCFMFLSLGSGTHGGVNNQPYTGLATAIKKFSIINKNGQISDQSGQYIGWEGYEIGADKNTSLGTVGATTCGTRVTEKGIRMYRGWTIPTGNSDQENVLNQDLTIDQFMVSPSSGSDNKGSKAFSLVDRTIFVPSGYSATITYQLSIDFLNYSSPYTFFSGKAGTNTNGFFNTGGAITGINGSDERELLSSWSNLSGIFRQIVPGLEIVDGVGACVSPDKMGSDLEPKNVYCENTFFYLSPNISQFALSKTGKSSDQYEAYNSIGLMANYYELAYLLNHSVEINSDSENSKAYEDPNAWFYSGDSVLEADTQNSELLMPENPRLTEILNISNYKTGALNLSYKTQNYTGAKNFPVAFATPGKIGFNYSFADFGQKFVRSTYLKRMPIDSSVRSTGTRFKYVTKKAIIPPLYSYGTNSRYGTLTLGYNNSNSNLLEDLSISPYIDFLFFDNEGRGSNMAHYRYIPTIYLKDRGTGIAKVRFDIVLNSGNALPDITYQNNSLFFDNINGGYFNSLNNGNSEFYLYGYKDIQNERFFSNPVIYTGYSNIPGQGFPYNIQFTWDQSSNYDGYYVLVYNLPQLGIQSLNIKSGVIISNPVADLFTIGKTNAANYVEGIGYLQDLSNVNFLNEINPFSTAKPESVNRFYSVYGFMGSGVDIGINPSGLDVTHSYLNNTIIDSNSKFIPVGNKTSGFLFPGQVLNSSVEGNKNSNNGTGYGAVYGVIGNSGFYLSQYDLCLLDIPNWSGLGGNPTGISVLGFDGSTGFVNNLCWPHYSKKLRLKLSELEYYASGIGNIVDSIDYFKDNQIIKDIQIPKSGAPSIYESMVTGGVSSKIFVCTGTGILINSSTLTDGIINFRIKDEFSNFLNLKFSGVALAEAGSYTKVIFTGFLSGFSLNEKGYGSNLKFPMQVDKISGIYNGVPTEFFLKNNRNSGIIPNTSYSFIPANFKKPEAYIFHTETTGNDVGYRMLPNYALANTGNVNTYSPVTGGTLPGLSIENGMDLYLTITWTGA